MKKTISLRTMIRSALLFIVFSFLAQETLTAQPTPFLSSLTQTVFGTSDSRMATTINQSGEKITMTVGLVGRAVMQASQFNVYYDHTKLCIANSSFEAITAIGNATPSQHPEIMTAVRVYPELSALSFDPTTLCAVLEAGTNTLIYQSGRPDKRLFAASIMSITSALTVVEEDFVPLFDMFFVRIDSSDALITLDDIGFGIRNGLAKSSIQWMYEVTQITYANNGQTGGYVHPELFYYRSPSSVATNDETAVTRTSATLNATFSRGIYQPANNILDHMSGTQNGKIDWDTITKQGFIYTKAEVNALTVKEYSNIISIDETEYSLSIEDISNGFFTVGTDIFYIVLNNNVSANQNVSYSDNIDNLESGTTYNAWALAMFTWQTSAEYPIVGERITFTTIDCNTFPAPVINTMAETEFSLKEYEELYLFVEVEGSVEYQWYFEGETIDGATLSYYTDLFDESKKGTYSVSITNLCHTLFAAFSVQFEKNQYYIEARAYTGGTISQEGTVIVTQGDSKTFDITPNTDYQISDVLVDGVSQGAVASYTFNDVKANATIEAYFEYSVGIVNNKESGINVFSSGNVVTIVNKELFPLKQVEIADMFGRLVWKGHAPNTKTEITLGVATGVYVVRIITEKNQHIVAKVNINNML
jgi:hypothetical protein